MGVKYSKHGFLEYLYSIGYKIYLYDGTLLNEMPRMWSSFEPSMVKLINQECPDRVIKYGIMRAGLVVDITDTLRYPLPPGVEDDNAVIRMSEIFKTTDPEKIYNSLW